MEAELLVVLNMHIEHNFQGVFKNGTSSGNGAYALKRTNSGVVMASRSQISF
jgi:hypothetical protein